MDFAAAAERKAERVLGERFCSASLVRLLAVIICVVPLALVSLALFPQRAVSFFHLVFFCPRVFVSLHVADRSWTFSPSAGETDGRPTWDRWDRASFCLGQNLPLTGPRALHHGHQSICLGGRACM